MVQTIVVIFPIILISIFIKSARGRQHTRLDGILAPEQGYLGEGEVQVEYIYVLGANHS